MGARENELPLPVQRVILFAGFEDFEITRSEDVFEGAPRPRQEIADFGTRGVNFRARKA